MSESPQRLSMIFGLEGATFDGSPRPVAGPPETAPSGNLVLRIGARNVEGRGWHQTTHLVMDSEQGRAYAAAILAALDEAEHSRCAACDDSGVVVEVEPVGDGTVSHTFPCVCPRGRELDAERHEEDEVDRLVRESEPDSVELAAQREAVAMRDWRCSCDRGEGRIDRGCAVHGAGVEA